MEHLTIVASRRFARAAARCKASEALDRGVVTAAVERGWQNDLRDRDRRHVRLSARAFPVGARKRGCRSPTSRSCSAGVTARVVRGRDLGRRHPIQRDLFRQPVDGKMKFQQLTHQNDALFAELQLGTTEEVIVRRARTARTCMALLTKPVGYVAGTKVPMLLRIHGGPNGQDQHSFSIRAAVVRRERLRGAGGELSRQRGTRHEFLEGDLPPTGGTTRSTICRPASIRSSRWALPIRTGSASAAGATAVS